MSRSRSKRLSTPILTSVVALSLAGCGGAGLGLRPSEVPADDVFLTGEAGTRGTTIWDALRPSNAGTNVKVNKYIWTAALDVLNFLPVETVDPFTGVIVTGYGRPPGGGRAYRATIHVADPALEARSLNLSLLTRNGPASVATVRAVEDAILARARQLRVADARL